ncbi:Protein kintoun [Quaeritorhiza haematococci]|nr:Protein kintoun [Quaeritorhiza haematococci]
MMGNRNQDDKFEMTQDEVQRFQAAFKEKEFRDLFADYLKELTDPENRKRYEEEILKLEAEKGISARFLKPEPKHVIKTKIFLVNKTPDPKSLSSPLAPSAHAGKFSLPTFATKDTKVFINICTSPDVEKASAKSSPMATSAPGGNVNAKKVKGKPKSKSAKKDCLVFDATFNPETYEFGRQIPVFMKMLCDTAIEFVENACKIELEKDYKTLKMKSKGPPAPAFLKDSKRASSNPPQQREETSVEYIEKEVEKQRKMEKEEEAVKRKTESENTLSLHGDGAAGAMAPPRITVLSEERQTENNGHRGSGMEGVKFRIIQRGLVEFDQFTNERVKVGGRRPNALVIKIELPLVTKASDVELDTAETEVTLRAPSKYPNQTLHIPLPFPTDHDKGAAKFERSRRELVVTLPVVPPPMPEGNPETLVWGGESANTAGDDDNTHDDTAATPINDQGKEDDNDAAISESVEPTVTTDVLSEGRDVQISSLLRTSEPSNPTAMRSLITLLDDLPQRKDKDENKDQGVEGNAIEETFAKAAEAAESGGVSGHGSVSGDMCKELKEGSPLPVQAFEEVQQQEGGPNTSINEESTKTTERQVGGDSKVDAVSFVSLPPASVPTYLAPVLFENSALFELDD